MARCGLPCAYNYQSAEVTETATSALWVPWRLLSSTEQAPLTFSRLLGVVA